METQFSLTCLIGKSKKKSLPGPKEVFSEKEIGAIGTEGDLAHST